MGIFPKYLEKFEIISKKVGKVPKYLESIPKKLEYFQKFWNQFNTISKKVGKLPKYLESIPKRLESVPKKL